MQYWNYDILVNSESTGNKTVNNLSQYKYISVFVGSIGICLYQGTTIPMLFIKEHPDTYVSSEYTYSNNRIDAGIKYVDDTTLYTYGKIVVLGIK